MPSFEEDTLRIARQLFDNKHNGVVDIPLMKKTAAYLRQAIVSGYGTQTDEQDRQMISTLENNAFVFSGFKTYQTLKEISSKLVDENGNVRGWDSFKKEVLKVDKTYNVNYLKAEYDHALICGQVTSQWQDIQRNKHILKYLVFDATNDNRTTQICLSLDGVRLPVDHPFWDTYYLPLHFGERSVIRQESGGTITDISKINKPDLNPMFEGNVGKTGIAFPASHPYYEASLADKKTIQQSIDKVFADPQNTKVVYTKNDKQLTIHNLHNKKELKANTRIGKLLVDKGNDVMLPPHKYDSGVKNPDAIINGNQVADFKGMEEPTMNAAYGAIKRAGKQGAEICVLEPVKSLSKHDLKRAIFAALGNSKRSTTLKELWLIYKKKVVVITRAEVASGSFVDKLE